MVEPGTVEPLADPEREDRCRHRNCLGNLAKAGLLTWLVSQVPLDAYRKIRRCNNKRSATGRLGDLSV